MSLPKGQIVRINRNTAKIQQKMNQSNPFDTDQPQRVQAPTTHIPRARAADIPAPNLTPEEVREEVRKRTGAVNEERHGGGRWGLILTLFSFFVVGFVLGYVLRGWPAKQAEKTQVVEKAEKSGQAGGDLGAVATLKTEYTNLRTQLNAVVKEIGEERAARTNRSPALEKTPEPPKPKATVLGLVLDEEGKPVTGAKIRTDNQTVRAGGEGLFSLPLFAESVEVEVSASGYLVWEGILKSSESGVKVVLKKGTSAPKAEEKKLESSPANDPKPAPATPE
jgi:hypothetical protein